MTFGLFSSGAQAQQNGFAAGTVTLSQSVSHTCSTAGLAPGDGTPAGGGTSNNGTEVQCKFSVTYGGAPAYLGLDVSIQGTALGAAGTGSYLYDSSATGLQVLIQDDHGTRYMNSNGAQSGTGASTAGTFLGGSATSRLQRQRERHARHRDVDHDRHLRVHGRLRPAVDRGQRLPGRSIGDHPDRTRGAGRQQRVHRRLPARASVRLADELELIGEAADRYGGNRGRTGRGNRRLRVVLRASGGAGERLQRRDAEPAGQPGGSRNRRTDHRLMVGGGARRRGHRPGTELYGRALQRLGHRSGARVRRGGLTTLSCQDSPPGSSFYEYAITAHYNGWSTTSAFTNAVSLAPDAPISIALANGSGQGNAYINGGNALHTDIRVALDATSATSDTVTLTVSDLGGVHTITNTAPGTAGAGTVQFHNLNVQGFLQGLITFSATVTDSGGDVSGATTASVYMDSTPPVTTIAIHPPAPNGASGWYDATPTFTLSASDSGSGVATTMYEIDGGTATAYTGLPVSIPDGSSQTLITGASTTPGIPSRRTPLRP